MTRNQYYKALVDAALPPLRNIAGELRLALQDPSQFLIRYQPIVQTKTNKVKLAEALVRWESTIYGDVLPGRFISVAEENGLIRALTGMVLRKICTEIASQPELVISINVSPRDLADPTFSDQVAATVGEFGVCPHQIVLEATARIPAEFASEVARTLRKLRSLGHAVAIYELEIGFTSFGFLKMPDFTLLKIDRELIDEALENADSRVSLQEAIDVAHARGFKILAVGVETEAQKDLVEAMQFDLQQGFYHSEALLIEDLLEFEQKNSERIAS